MRNTENLDRFVELRAQGLSVPKISEKLGIPASTLYDWDERVRARIQNLRLVALEPLEDRILGTQNAQCEAIASHLKAIDKQIGTEIDNGTIEHLSLPELIRLSASLRRELYRFKLHSLEQVRRVPESRVGRGVPAEPRDPSSPIQNEPVGRDSIECSQNELVGRDSVEPNPKP